MPIAHFAAANVGICLQMKCLEMIFERFFIESAILYEAGLDELCDRIIVVEAPEEVRIARTIQRDYRGEATEENIDKVRARIQAQKAVCHQPGQTCISPQRVVHNDGKVSIEELVSEILQELQRCAKP